MVDLDDQDWGKGDAQAWYQADFHTWKQVWDQTTPMARTLLVDLVTPQSQHQFMDQIVAQIRGHFT